MSDLFIDKNWLVVVIRWDNDLLTRICKKTNNKKRKKTNKQNKKVSIPATGHVDSQGD